MFVAGHHHVIVGYVDVSGGRWGTQEADCVQCHLELWTGANEGTPHRLYLHNSYQEQHNNVIKISLVRC